MLIRPIARLIFRGTDENDGLIFGVAKKSHDFFKPNTVYELIDCDGSFSLREVGCSLISQPGPNPEKSPLQLSWGDSINDILMHAPDIYLTREEYALVMQHRANKDDD